MPAAPFTDALLVTLAAPDPLAMAEMPFVPTPVEVTAPPAVTDAAPVFVLTVMAETPLTVPLVVTDAAPDPELTAETAVPLVADTSPAVTLMSDAAEAVFCSASMALPVVAVVEPVPATVTAPPLDSA